MRLYSVDEAFTLLKRYKITTNKESVRRWLRQGDIKGIRPTSRKAGWSIPQKNLFDFIHNRLPNSIYLSNDTTNDVKKAEEADNKESIRAEMWWELARKYIFEGYIEPKKAQIQECIEHNGHSKELEAYVWHAVSQHKMGYAKPHIPYLLDAFLFDGQRIKFNQCYELFEEKILYALIEHLRKKRVKKENETN